MTVRNVHTRELPAPVVRVRPLIDGLASDDDRLWPHDRWPAMRFDGPLAVGAVGGHGPIRYTIEQYEPGQSIQFRFTKPVGFYGWHRIDLEEIDSERSRLTHTVAMKPSVVAKLQWSFVIGPLHDALIEDALDRAEYFVSGKSIARSWSPWVRFLRSTMKKKRKRK